MVWERLQGGRNNVSATNFRDWKSRSHVFEEMAAGVVGGRLAAKAAEETCSHGPGFKQKNDLYFLLRLANEA